MKFKEDDDDEFDTYEMFHYHIAGVGKKGRSQHSVCRKQSPQNLECSVETNPFEKSFKTVHAQKND